MIPKSTLFGNGVFLSEQQVKEVPKKTMRKKNQQKNENDKNNNNNRGGGLL